MSTAQQVARRRLRRARHTAALALPGVLEVITCNDQYTDRVTDVPTLARTRKPLAIGAQESKGISYRNRLGDNWGVRQDMTNDATAGVAVIWNKHLARSLHNGGWLALVEPRRGDDMLTRGAAWQDLQVIATSAKVRVISTHRPKKTLRHLWAAFDDALEAFIEASPHPVIVCMDANETGGPNVDIRWRGIGIDGVLTDLPVLSVYELSFARSDHRPVSVAVRTGGRRVRP